MSGFFRGFNNFVVVKAVLHSLTLAHDPYEKQSSKALKIAETQDRKFRYMSGILC